MKIADYGKAITSYIESPTTAQKLKSKKLAGLMEEYLGDQLDYQKAVDEGFQGTEEEYRRYKSTSEEDRTFLAEGTPFDFSGLSVPQLKLLYKRYTGTDGPSDPKQLISELKRLIKGLDEDGIPFSTGGRVHLAEGSEDIVEPSKSMQVDTTTKGLDLFTIDDFKKKAKIYVGAYHNNALPTADIKSALNKFTQKGIDDGTFSADDAIKIVQDLKFQFQDRAQKQRLRDNIIAGTGTVEREDFQDGLSAAMKKRIKNFETMTGENYADQPAWKRFDIREGNWKGTGSKVKLTDEMKANIKEFEDRTGLKYEDVDLQKKKAIRDGKRVGILPTKKEMKLRISVNDKGVPIFPNKQMEKEFIKDIKNKFKYPKASKNIPEDLKASGLAKKYPISERQVERATKYYKDKLNLTYPKGMDAPEITEKRKEYINKNSNRKFENFLKGNPEFHKSHMSDLYTQKVKTSTLGYAKANINLEDLKDIDAKMNALYKKTNKLLKDKPKNLNILLDEINQKGTDLAAQSGGYKKFEATDPFTKKKFVINFSSAAQELDPTELLGNKELSKLTEADKPLLKNLKDIGLKNIARGVKTAGKVIKPLGYAFGANAVKSAISKADDMGIELSLADKIMAFDSGDADIAINNYKRRNDPEFAAAERAKDLAQMTDDFEEVGQTTFGKYNDQIKNIKLP